MSSEYDKYYTIADSSQDNFQFGPNPFAKEKVSDVAIVKKDDTKLDENAKVPCTNCTNRFFEIFFKDTEKYQEDPIMQDILSKEVYMQWDALAKCWKCVKCGAIQVPDNVIMETNKKLKAFGQEEYRQYDKITKNKPDYIHTLNKKRVDINNLMNDF